MDVYKKKLDPIFFDSHDLPSLANDLDELLKGDIHDYKGMDKGLMSKSFKTLSGVIKIPFKSK